MPASLSARSPHQRRRTRSARRSCARCGKQGIPIIVPTLLIPEIAAAIGRGQGKPDLGYSFAIEVSQFPNVTLINLNESLAETAAEIAATYRLRGSDAVYAAVAKRFATQLITLDRKQLQRVKKVVSV